MKLFKTFCVFGVVFATILPEISIGQNRVTDANGTTYLQGYAPPTVRRPNVSTGPIQSNTRAGRPTIGQNSGFTGTASVATQQEELLVNQLLGVVLVPTPSDVRPGGWPGVEGVWHDFKDFPPEVGWALQKYLCKPVSLTSLDRMVKDVIVAYREGDRPVVDVLLPEQDITSGVVQLVVIESKLGRIRVEGVDADTEEYIRSQVRSRKGEVIRASTVLHDLAWLNRSPYRKVDLAYAPGRDFGTTDIILKPYEQDKGSVFFGFEDSGTDFLGRERFVFGANMGEFFNNPTQSLAYQFTSDFDFEHVRAHSVVYSKDLPWRHNITFLASFVDINAQIPTGIPLAPTIESEGFNWGLAFRYNIPLESKTLRLCEPLLGDVERRRDFHFGFDFKSNENDLEFSGVLNQVLATALDNQVEIYQFTVGYQEVWQWQKAVSQFNVAGFFSPGGFSPHNTADTFGRARAFSDPRYYYVTASFEHQQRLIQDWSLRMKLMGQLADSNLQASEQFGVGGYDRVRGFDQRVVLGDEGVYSTVELYTPELSLARIFDWPYAHGPCTDRLRFLAFVDAGSVGNKQLLPGEPESQSIASTGVGMRWTYNDFFNLRVDYGHPVLTDNVIADQSGRFHIGATATF